MSGIVTLKVAIATAGSNPIAFTVPSAYRPSTAVHVPVDMCGAANDRLLVCHDGRLDVDPEGAFGLAQCTSLEGVSGRLDTTGFTVQPPPKGWINDFTIRDDARQKIGGVRPLRL